MYIIRCYNINKNKVTQTIFREGGLCVVMDPPFGGRVEPLVYTLNELATLYRKVCEKPESDILPVMWAFPYFSEPYIRNLIPEMKMHDYQVSKDLLWFSRRTHEFFSNVCITLATLVKVCYLKLEGLQKHVKR